MIPVLQPHADQKIIDEMTKVLKSGWWGAGPITKQAEEEFAKYVGAKYAIGCNSGTAALDLCLKAYEIKGGELITTPMTFVADAIVGEWNDMDVTFADIDKTTLEVLEDKINNYSEWKKGLTQEEQIKLQTPKTASEDYYSRSYS